MPAAAKPKPRTPRQLLEWSAGAARKVDRARKVIEGVRVLGRYSRNSHGYPGAENGTEYTPECMEKALPLYEGADVLWGHEEGRRPNGGTDDVAGVLRNARVEGDGDSMCIRADLHYFDSHPRTPRLLEDAERPDLSRFGLSHDARAGRERFDRAARRLVIESLSAVKSVDLVRKPATNRNLFEEQRPVSTTLRTLLESRLPKLSKPRRAWARTLLEDDMAPAMDAPVEGADDSSDPDSMLWSGFKSAIMAILDGDGSAEEKAKKIAKYLKAHDKLTSGSEPDAPSDVEEEEEDDKEKKSDDEKTEAVKQENEKLKRQLAARNLVEEAGLKADPALLESLEELPADKARKLVEREKARGGQPRSSGFGGTAGTGGGGGQVPTGSGFSASIRD